MEWKLLTSIVTKSQVLLVILWFQYISWSKYEIEVISKNKDAFPIKLNSMVITDSKFSNFNIKYRFPFWGPAVHGSGNPTVPACFIKLAN